MTFVTMLSVVGVSSRVAQKLARHTDLKFTTNVYTDSELLGGWEAVEALPELSGAVQNDVDSSEEATVSGTDAVAPSVALECVPDSPEASPTVTMAVG